MPRKRPGGSGSGWRRLTATALVGGCVAATPVMAQKKPYPVFTADQFVSAMKTVGLAEAAMTAAIAKGEFEDSKAYLSISRERLATTITFWRDQQKDDAIGLLRDALTKMDELDAALSPSTPDLAAVAAAAKQVQSACQPCHARYREQDPGSKAFRLKPELTR
jgi:cytochrome c556